MYILVSFAQQIRLYKHHHNWNTEYSHYSKKSPHVPFSLAWPLAVTFLSLSIVLPILKFHRNGIFTACSCCFFFFNIYLFIYLWLCWVFVSVRGLSAVAASGGHSSSRCAGLSLSRPRPLRSTGSRRAGSVAVAHGPSCSAACGIFPDQGLNPCPLH